MASLRKPVIVVTGPTGSGKSNLIYSLPQNLPITVISADSRQIYRGLPILTAMPTAEQLSRFPHELIHFLPLQERYSAGDFAKDCKAAIEKAHSAKRLPVIVGGTFFYIKTLWDGIPEAVQVDNETEEAVAKLDNQTIHTQLLQLDPDAAGAIHPQDTYRLRRALAVSLTLQKTKADFRYSERKYSPGQYNEFEFFPCWLDLNRQELYDRINARTAAMFENNVIMEIVNAIEQGNSWDSPGLQTIGIPEILGEYTNASEFVDDWHKGCIDAKQVENWQQKIATSTRRYAKRQLTWFRHEPRLKRFDPHIELSQLSGIIENSIRKL